VKNVTFSSETPSVCSVVGSSVDHATVSFIGAGTCTIVAKQAGDVKYEPEAETQSFVVGKGSQAITFTTTAPSSATVAGPAYTVTATGGGSGNPVTITIDAASSSACSIAGSTVSFIGVGTCVIDANQAGDAAYNAATQAQQSFAVGSAPTLTPPLTPPSTPPPIPPPTSTPTPNSNFSLLRNPTINPKTGAIAFNGSVGHPGAFSWLVTFPNGKFGAYQARKTSCKAAQVKLKGRCRPAKILFGQGSTAVSAGIVSFTVTPSASASGALKNALKKKRGLAVTAILTFQSSRGAVPYAVDHRRAQEGQEVRGFVRCWRSRTPAATLGQPRSEGAGWVRSVICEAARRGL
jgi:hypothetical protein